MKRDWVAGFIASIGVGAGLLTTSSTANVSCMDYFTSTKASYGIANVVSDDLLRNHERATGCLLEVLTRLGKDTSTVDDIDNSETVLTLLSVTSAFRRMIADANARSGSSGVTRRLWEFISFFRHNDNIDVISVLSYAVRSKNRDLRLNSVLILGNVIDNSTVCVPLIHLNDSSLMNTGSGVNGRANLLGVVSVVAPWAYRENFESTEATVTYIVRDLDQKDDVAQTLRIIRNIEQRLKDQKKISMPNKNTSLINFDGGATLGACKTYLEDFWPKVDSNGRANLRY